MRILGIDPGTTPGNKCGWALIEDGELIRYDYFKYTKTGMDRMKKIEEDFKDLFAKIKNIDHLALEKPYGPNRQSLETMNILFGIIFSKAISAEIFDFEFYHPSHVKKVVTGDGRASKNDINDYVCSYYNIEEDVQKDVADAIGIALTAVRNINQKI
jgi:crossover junction endodeoxyribonuclease RuvC